MNFLEELVAEWYEFQGYFVTRNVKYGRRSKGGYEGEMDVVTYHPQKGELVHIEVSGDADSNAERKRRIEKKFSTAQRHYSELFKFPNMTILKVAVMGYNRIKCSEDWGDIKYYTIPGFVRDVVLRGIYDFGSKHKNWSIEERFPILRSMQFALSYQEKK